MTPQLRTEQLRAALAALEERAAGREGTAYIWGVESIVFAIGNDGSFSIAWGDLRPAFILPPDETRHLFTFWRQPIYTELTLMLRERFRREDEARRIIEGWGE